MWRAYLVAAVGGQKTPAMQHFFRLFADELTAPDWAPWFRLPHLHEPEKDPLFSVYFSRGWAETFRVSLQNVIAAALEAKPAPSLMRFGDAHREVIALREENKHLREALVLKQRPTTPSPE